MPVSRGWRYENQNHTEASHFLPGVSKTRGRGSKALCQRPFFWDLWTGILQKKLDFFCNRRWEPRVAAAVPSEAGRVYTVVVRCGFCWASFAASFSDSSVFSGDSYLNITICIYEMNSASLVLWLRKQTPQHLHLGEQGTKAECCQLQVVTAVEMEVDCGHSANVSICCWMLCIFQKRIRSACCASMLKVSGFSKCWWFFFFFFA